MTDGNTYAINKHLDDLEDYDALQEVTAELEQAEAETKKYHDAWLEAEVKIVELEAKLAKAVELAEEALYLDGDKDVCAAWCSLWERLEELKGQDDE